MITRRRSSQAAQLVSSAMPVPFHEDEFGAYSPRERRLSSMRSSYFPESPSHAIHHVDSYYTDLLSMSCPLDTLGTGTRNTSIPRASNDWGDLFKVRSLANDTVVEDGRKWEDISGGREYAFDPRVPHGVSPVEGEGAPTTEQQETLWFAPTLTEYRSPEDDGPHPLVRPRSASFHSVPPPSTFDPAHGVETLHPAPVVDARVQDRTHLKRTRAVALAGDHDSDDEGGHDEDQEGAEAYVYEQDDDEAVDDVNSGSNDRSGRATSHPRSKRRLSSSPLTPIDGSPLPDAPLSDGDPPPVKTRPSRAKKSTSAPRKRTIKTRVRTPVPKKPEGYAPRPPNNWILYRSEQIRLLRSESSGPRKPQSDISKMIGLMWKDESPEVRKWYDEQAELKKLEHLRMYPGYRYAPIRKPKVPKTKEEDVALTRSKRVRSTKNAGKFSADRSTKSSPRPDVVEPPRYQYNRPDAQYPPPHNSPPLVPYHTEQEIEDTMALYSQRGHVMDESRYRRDMQRHHDTHQVQRSPLATTAATYRTLAPDPSIRRPSTAPHPIAYQHVDEHQYLSSHTQAHLPQETPVPWTAYSTTSDVSIITPSPTSDMHSTHWYPSTPATYVSERLHPPSSAPPAAAQFSYAPAYQYITPGSNDPVYYSERIRYGPDTTGEAVGDGGGDGPVGYRLDSLFGMSDTPERRFSRADSIWALQRGADPNSAQGRGEHGIMSEEFDQLIDPSRYPTQHDAYQHHHQQHFQQQQQQRQHQHHEQHRADRSEYVDAPAGYLDVSIPAPRSLAAYAQDKGAYASMERDPRMRTATM